MKYFILLFSFTVFSCNSGGNSELDKRLTQLEKENNQLKEQIGDKNPKIDDPATHSQQNTNPFPQNNSQKFEPASNPSLNIGGNTRFVYIVIKTKEPELVHHGGTYIPNSYGGLRKTDEINYVKWENYIYTSEIKEIQNYNEDKKFRLMDEVEGSARQKLFFKDSNFSSEVYRKVSGDDKISELQKNTGEIIDRKALVFDTYKQASEHRNKNKGNF